MKKYYNNNAIKIKKAFIKLGAEKIEINKGYNYHSGFITFKNKIFYFSTGDYRLGADKMLIRTAKDYRDFSGGSNNFIKNNDDLFEIELARFLYNYAK